MHSNPIVRIDSSIQYLLWKLSNCVTQMSNAKVVPFLFWVPPLKPCHWTIHRTHVLSLSQLGYISPSSCSSRCHSFPYRASIHHLIQLVLFANPPQRSFFKTTKTKHLFILYFFSFVRHIFLKSICHTVLSLISRFASSISYVSCDIFDNAF